MTEAPIAYLAHPVDHRLGGQAHTLVSVLWEQLHGAGFTVYDPERSWNVQGEPRRNIWQVNIWTLARAEALMAILPDDMDTIGVPMEIERAGQLGLPTVVIGGDRARRSWALAGHTATGRCKIVGDSAAEIAMAISWLKQQVTEIEDRLTRQRRARLTGEGPVPTKTYESDVGWDLYYHGTDVLWVQVGGVVDVPAGVQIEWPEGMWALVLGRSSSFKRGLLCNPGVIDPGYRGDYFAVLQNVSRQRVSITPGERIAQAIPMHAPAGITMQRVERLSSSERGTAGFGSSGR